MHMLSANAISHLCEAIILVVLSAMGIYLVPAVIKYINTNGWLDNSMASAIGGAIVSIVVIGFINIYRDYAKVNQLETALLLEIGLIARALYHDIKTNQCIDENIKETFSVDHAIIHSVGSNIALLNHRIAGDILEFHSLMKVLCNIHSMKSKKIDTSETVLMQITKIINRHPLCTAIIEQSSISKENLSFWTQKVKQQNN